MSCLGNILGLVAAAGAVALCPAEAVQLRADFSGRIASGFDASGFFGTSSDLTDVFYTLSFTYDPALGHGAAGPDFQYVEGGTSSGDASPVLDVTLTIAGFPRSIRPNVYGFAALGFTPASFGFDGVSYVSPIYEGTFLTGLASAVPASLTNPIGPTSFSGGVGEYQLAYDADTDDLIDPYVEAFMTFGSEGTYSVSEVPEPATWAMLAGGFGLIGAALRRRMKRANLHPS